MTQGRIGVLRIVAAVAIVAAACPTALFGSGFAGCAGRGFNSDCAFTGAILSPITLIVAGIVAALLVRGRRGYLCVVAGVVIGMAAIFVLTALGGTILPFEVIAITLWMLWFLAPVSLGFVFGAVGAWLLSGDGSGGQGQATAPPGAGRPSGG